MWVEKQSRNTARETKQAPLLNKGVTSDEEEYEGDYSSKWEYLGKGIWENQVRYLDKTKFLVSCRYSPCFVITLTFQDYGTMSACSTLRSGMATGSR